MASIMPVTRAKRVIRRSFLAQYQPEAPKLWELGASRAAAISNSPAAIITLSQESARLDAINQHATLIPHPTAESPPGSTIA